MGNDLMDDKEFKEMQPEDKLIDDYRYGIISKKEDERSLDDMYLILPDLHSSENADKKVDFSLFGVFDGHNSNYVAKYISENIKALYEKETASIKNENYKVKIEEIFKTIDKNLKEEEDKKENDIIKENEKKPENEIIENANVINDNNDNIINTEKKEKEKVEKKEKKHYINVGVDEKEINLFKEVIQNSNDIPEELKKVDDSQIKDLLLFRNLFKYNNNYLYNDNDVDYIGSSASIVLINDTNVITADLGITKCILFNKEGEIKNMKDLNPQDIYEKLKNTHTFNSKDEKKRVKKFNKTIDYNNLTLNIYVPASRCFGLYKYKQDEILKPENQIISCVPDVNCFNKNEIDYILLLTKGMINLIGNDLKGLITKIVNALNGVTIDNKDFKITKIIEEYISQKKLDEEHNKQNNTIKNKDSGLTNKQLATKTNSSIYIGKDDFSEENIIINELNNNYYKDIMNMNKNNDPSFSGKLNTTCVLIQLYKTNKKKEDKKVEDNIIINEDKKEEVKKEDNNNNNQIKEKVENKIEEEKKEGGENKIEEINVIEEKNLK
jgi:serine/threonine protein phosphatase PrpC